MIFSKDFRRRLGAVVVSAGFAALSACGGVDPNASRGEAAAGVEGELTSIELSDAAMERSGVEIVRVVFQNLPLTLRATGKLQLDEERTARVGAPAEGRVTHVDVLLGQPVERDQLLLRIHAHELASARSDHSKAQAELAAAEEAGRYAADEAKRGERLLAAKAISLREQLRAAVEHEAALASLEVARAELERAEEVLRHLGAAPGEEGELSIRSSIAGVVLDRNISVGSVVTTGQPLVTVSDISSLWLVAEVPERESGPLRVGQTVAFTVPAFAEQPFSGKVFHVGEILDPETRTVAVRARVANEEGRLRPEMYADVDISLGASEGVIAIPAAGVQTLGGQATAFVSLGRGRFERASITTGRESGGWVEVTDGLSAGQSIVSAGSFLIKSEFLRGRIEEE